MPTATLTLLLVMNVLTFALFAIDKWKARTQRWRIPETTLLLGPLLGGAPAGWFAMALFRHKTSKAAFRLKMVLVTLANGFSMWLMWREGLLTL